MFKKTKNAFIEYEKNTNKKDKIFVTAGESQPTKNKIYAYKSL